MKNILLLFLFTSLTLSAQSEDQSPDDIKKETAEEILNCDIVKRMIRIKAAEEILYGVASVVTSSSCILAIPDASESLSTVLLSAALVVAITGVPHLVNGILYLTSKAYRDEKACEIALKLFGLTPTEKVAALFEERILKEHPEVIKQYWIDPEKLKKHAA